MIHTVEHFLEGFRVVGKPRQTRRDRWQQRPAVVQYRAFADELRDLVGYVPPGEFVVSVDWIAGFEPPRSWSKRLRAAAIGTLHRAKPDRDNIDKSILDALWSNDSGIAAGVTLKQWSAGDFLRLRIRWTTEPAVDASSLIDGFDYRP